MAFEGWWICDVCGKRVNRNDKHGMKTWIDIDIEQHERWGKDMAALLDASACSYKCAVDCVRAWLDEQDKGV